MPSEKNDVQPQSVSVVPQQSLPALRSRPYHVLSQYDVAQEFGTDPDSGLSDGEAQVRIQHYGHNELEGGGGVSPIKILVKQVVNAMMLVLILAMVVSFAINSYIEGAVVAAVIVLNIIVGFFQEYAAEKTMDSLRSLSSPTAQVIRDGHTKVIPTAELVPGDVVQCRVGDTIPADLRLYESMNFETDEALLTGESLPVAKFADTIFKESDETGVGDRINLAYASSTVTKGRAKGIVIATGMKTEIGAIAESLRTKPSKVRQVKRKADGSAGLHRYAAAGILTVGDTIGRFLGVNIGTPLQRKLSKLAIFLFVIAVVFALVVLGANRFRNDKEVIIYAVATGLSMIPASLIVVLTITMAVGTKRMVKRNVIVRKLDSLEALGAVTNICSDKTGTLTQGKMVAKRAWIPARGVYSVEEISEPFNPTIGSLTFSTMTPSDAETSETGTAPAGTPVNTTEHLDNSHLASFLHITSLCNLATVSKDRQGVWTGRGDPTEIAMQVFACRFGMARQHLIDERGWAQLAEYPFDSDVKRMSVVFRDSGPEPEHNNGIRKAPEDWAFLKGAVERVLEACTHIMMEDGKRVFDDSSKANVLQNMESLAKQGLRVLALASRQWTEHVDDWSEYPRAQVEKDMTLLGLIGLYDPPRPESAESVRKCHRSGIAVHMLTGDHPGTATAIAQQVGILPKALYKLAPDIVKAVVMTAAQFDKLTDEEIDALPILPLVIARCAPQTKVRMVDALHRRKCFVAMTGDGVNDSPSLKRADVGIAMGLAGSDVAKDAADIVLTDDNFASILNAIEEGRRMFDNIQKFVLHLLAENIAQASTLLVGLAFKDSTGLSVFPLAPVEILWIIMITSGMPDMGLGMEQATPDVMLRPPHDRKRGVFTNEVLLDMVVYGVWMSALCLASFTLVVFGFGDGNLGSGCNSNYSELCDTVFRARATTFTCLTWFALFLAWELVNFRRSFFRMQPKSTRYLTQWCYDIWRNQFLFWSIMAGFITIFPIIYIPTLNSRVFGHAPISWEWGIVFVEATLFFLGVEAWKFAKRVYFRRHNDLAHNPEDDLEMAAFSRYTTLAMNTMSIDVSK